MGSQSFKSFAFKWQNHVRFGNFEVSGPGPSGSFETSIRSILQISTSGLDDICLEILRREFLGALGPNLLGALVSHQSDPHAFFRVGAESCDLFSWQVGEPRQLRRQPYRLAKRFRVEAGIQLSENELQSFSAYIANIERDYKATLGPAAPKIIYKGEVVHDFNVRCVQTNLRENDNRMIDGSHHNCLTWFTTAPVGSNRSLWSLVDATSDERIKFDRYSWTVPFAHFLLMSQDDFRLPFLILQSKESLSAIDRNLRDPRYLFRMIDLEADPD